MGPESALLTQYPGAAGATCPETHLGERLLRVIWGDLPQRLKLAHLHKD